MRYFFLLFLLFSSLFLTAGSFATGQVQRQNQTVYTLQLQGFVWNHLTLNTLIVTADNASWWNPAYLNITLHAVGQWNDAIAAFASNYSDFSYLSNLKIQPSVSNTSKPGFDIYVNWTEFALSNMTDVIGLSQIIPNYRSTIINSTITLATHTNHGSSLGEGDMRNIALHEFGHSLGLGHSNFTGDLMYSTYTLGNSPRAVSSLDVYGVATLFAWKLNATNFYPVNDWLTENSVILPAAIAYQDLYVSPENAGPQTLADNPVVQFLSLMFAILVHPEILAIVILFFVVLVVIALIPKRKRSKET
jgi:hypothetical protein